MSILTVPEGTYKLHNDVFITTLDENTTDLETQRTLRLHFYKKNKFNKKLATLNGYNLSKKNIQYNIAREDNLIMQAIDYHDILSKNMVSSNNCLKEVWNNYFPEMKCNAAMILLLGDLSDLKLRIGEIRSGSVWNEIPSDIVEMVKEELKKEESINNNDSKNDKNKTDNSKTDKSKINNSKIDTSKSDNSKIDMRKIDNASFLDGIVELYENTIGIKMLDSDFHNLKTQAINILRTSTQCTNLKTYIESKIRTLCPNLFYLIDPLLCARLIVKAGGFSNLAKLPASTIQILGAEKALFRALKSKTNTPKHGILYGMQNVRSMANKIAIAARIDYFGNTDGEYGKRLKEGRTYDICKEVYQEIEKKKQEKEKNEKKQNEKKEIENDGKTGEKSENVKSKKSEKSKKDKSDKKKARKSDDTVKSADDTAKSVDETPKSVDDNPKSTDESKKFTIDVASNLEKEISKKVKKDIDSTVKLDDKNLSSFDDSMHEKGTKQNNDFLGENKNDPMVVKKKSTKKEKQKKEDKKGGKKEESKTKKNEKNDKDVVNDKSIVSEKSVAKSEKSIAKNEKKKDVSKTEKKDKKKDSQTEKKKESKKDDEKSVVSEKSVAKSDKKKDKKKESKKDDDKSVVSESKEKTKRKAAVPIPEKKVKKTKEKKEIEGEKEKKKSNKK